MSDLRVKVPVGACPASGGLTFSNTLSTAVLAPISATQITGVLPTPDSTLVVITYIGTGGVLPAYAPVASGLGSTTYIKLSGTAGAPVSGVISADNTIIYVGTSGDNLVHLITRSTLTDSSTLAPNLVDGNNNPQQIDFLVQKPRKTT